MRVLIADDNEDVCVALSLLLSINGYDVRTSTNGRDALSICVIWRPECAVLDVAMPNMGGIEVGQLVRKHGIPMRLIAMTGWGQPAVQARVVAAGFDMFLIKPVDIDTIKLAIERGVNKQSKRKMRGVTNND